MMQHSFTTGCLGVVLAAGIAFPSSAQEAHAPKIVCDEAIFDFGEIENSKIVEHDFVVRNEGTRTLEILKARPSCGCTVANITSKLVEPGESTTITAKLNLTGREGKQHKTIMVESNDPETKQLALLLQGTSVALVSIQPRTIMMQNMVQGEAATSTVSIISREDTPLEVTLGTTGNGHVDAKIVPVEGSNRVHVVVTTKPSLPKGASFGRITLQTNSKTQPVINVPYRYNVVGEISVYPTELAMLAQDKPLTRILTLGPGLVKEFQIQDVVVPIDSMQAKVQDLKNSRYRIVLSNVLPNSELNGKSLKIVTNAENMEEVEVPFKIVQRN